MIRTYPKVVVSLLFLCYIAAGIVRADCSNDLQVVIVAPVDAVDPVAGTVTVLGLTITVPATALANSSLSSGGHHGRQEGGGNGDGDNENENDGGDDNDGGTAGVPLTLDTLAVGTLVKISLVSDVAPLTATRITATGGYDTRVKIRGPIQAVDTTSTPNTVTVLGLVIDISTATVQGSNDDDSETVASTPVVLAVGQSAEIELDSTLLPALVALSLEVKNFTNQVGVELDDDQGNQIDNTGNDDSVEAVQTVKAIDPATGKIVRKTIHIHTTTSTGAFSLSGLAPGRARVTVTHGGKKYNKTVMVGTNGTSNVKIKVKKHK